MWVNVIRLGSCGLPLGIQSVNSDMYITLLTLENWIHNPHMQLCTARILTTLLLLANKTVAKLYCIVKS